MISKSNLISGAVTLVIVMVALAVHQKFVAPLLVKKAPATK